MNATIAAGLALVLLASPEPRAAESPFVADAKPDGDGILIHEIRSPYQSQPTRLRVLLPDDVKQGEKRSVIYLLPVEAGAENRYGDGLAEVRELNLHNSLGVIFAAPEFSDLPWYADHPTNPKIRQESHFLKVVIPCIEKTYPARTDADGRLLLGFSKSGWGAWSLLLRHPEVFGKAAAWDAPMMMDKPGKYGSGPIFGDAANFAAYQISAALRKRSDELHESRRLILLGYGNFRSEHQRIHSLLDQLRIAHEYRDGPARGHDWHSGWVREAAELLTAK